MDHFLHQWPWTCISIHFNTVSPSLVRNGSPPPAVIQSITSGFRSCDSLVFFGGDPALRLWAAGHPGEPRAHDVGPGHRGAALQGASRGAAPRTEAMDMIGFARKTRRRETRGRSKELGRLRSQRESFRLPISHDVSEFWSFSSASKFWIET